jgi:hypothetical protein
MPAKFILADKGALPVYLQKVRARLRIEVPIGIEKADDPLGAAGRVG